MVVRGRLRGWGRDFTLGRTLHKPRVDALSRPWLAWRAAGAHCDLALLGRREESHRRASVGGLQGRGHAFRASQFLHHALKALAVIGVHAQGWGGGLPFLFAQTGKGQEKCRHAAHHGNLFACTSSGGKHRGADVQALEPGADTCRSVVAQRAYAADESGEEQPRNGLILQALEQCRALLGRGKVGGGQESLHAIRGDTSRDAGLLGA